MMGLSEELIKPWKGCYFTFKVINYCFTSWYIIAIFVQYPMIFFNALYTLLIRKSHLPHLTHNLAKQRKLCYRGPSHWSSLWHAGNIIYQWFLNRYMVVVVMLGCSVYSPTQLKPFPCLIIVPRRYQALIMHCSMSADVSFPPLEIQVHKICWGMLKVMCICNMYLQVQPIFDNCSCNNLTCYSTWILSAQLM